MLSEPQLERSITYSCFVLLHRFLSMFSEMCLVQPDPGLYSFINQGVLTVDGIDDIEEMNLTDVSIS